MNTTDTKTAIESIWSAIGDKFSDFEDRYYDVIKWKRRCPLVAIGLALLTTGFIMIFLMPIGTQHLALIAVLPILFWRVYYVLWDEIGIRLIKKMKKLTKHQLLYAHLYQASNNIRKSMIDQADPDIEKLKQVLNTYVNESKILHLKRFHEVSKFFSKKFDWIDEFNLLMQSAKALGNFKKLIIESARSKKLRQLTAQALQHLCIFHFLKAVDRKEFLSYLNVIDHKTTFEKFVSTMSEIENKLASQKFNFAFWLFSKIIAVIRYLLPRREKLQEVGALFVSLLVYVVVVIVIVMMVVFLLPEKLESNPLWFGTIMTIIGTVLTTIGTAYFKRRMKE